MALFQGAIPGSFPERTLPGWIFLFQNKRASFWISSTFLETIANLLIWQTLPNQLPWVDTPFIVRGFFLDPGKMLNLGYQYRCELKEKMCGKYRMHKAPIKDDMGLEILTATPA